MGAGIRAERGTPHHHILFLLQTRPADDADPVPVIDARAPGGGAGPSTGSPGSLKSLESWSGHAQKLRRPHAGVWGIVGELCDSLYVQRWIG